MIFDRATATPSIDFTDYRFSADETRILLSTDVKPVYRRSFTAEYWIFDTKDGSLRRLSTGGPQQQAAFSPDGHRVAFVRDNDLFVADLADGAERRITSDGRKNHTVSPTGYTKRNSPSRGRSNGRPTDGGSPGCGSTKAASGSTI